MFDTFRKGIKQINKDENPKKFSFDFKLMLAYQIVMMTLFVLRPIDSPLHQTYLAVFLAFMLIIISIFHKLRSNWSWPGLSFTSIPSIAFNLVFTYIFLGFSSYIVIPGEKSLEFTFANIESLLIESWGVILQAASIPVLTPWFLSGVGIAFMNSTVSLNLATLKQSEFNAQCGNS
jgi:hypothetical protein